MQDYSCPGQSIQTVTGDSVSEQESASEFSRQRQRSAISDRDSEQHSHLRVQQPPGHRTALIEGIHRFTGSVRADRPGGGEELQVADHRLPLLVNDPEVATPSRNLIADR